jgi:hypothetical protein
MPTALSKSVEKSEPRGRMAARLWRLCQATNCGFETRPSHPPTSTSTRARCSANNAPTAYSIRQKHLGLRIYFVPRLTAACRASKEFPMRHYWQGGLVSVNNLWLYSREAITNTTFELEGGQQPEVEPRGVTPSSSLPRATSGPDEDSMKR